MLNFKLEKIIYWKFYTLLLTTIIVSFTSNNNFTRWSYEKILHKIKLFFVYYERSRLPLNIDLYFPILMNSPWNSCLAPAFIPKIPPKAYCDFCSNFLPTFSLSKISPLDPFSLSSRLGNCTAVLPISLQLLSWHTKKKKMENLTIKQTRMYATKQSFSPAFVAQVHNIQPTNSNINNNQVQNAHIIIPPLSSESTRQST